VENLAILNLRKFLAFFKIIIDTFFKPN
jgi:hypothetical protein